MKNLLNKKFGKLTVIRLHSKDNHRRIHWTCVCDCGNEKTIRYDHLLEGDTRSCGCLNRQNSWEGVGELGLSLFNHYKSSAKKRHIPFKVTMTYLWKLFLKQNKKCAITNDALSFSSYKNKFGQRRGNASLDRIDNSKGYVVGNVQWVTKDVNMCKGMLNMESFACLCKKVINNYEKK